MPSDKDREEARKILDSLGMQYDPEVIMLEIARIRAEAKAECEQFYAITSARALDDLKRQLREKYAMEFRKNKIEWETSVKAEARREAAERACAFLCDSCRPKGTALRDHCEEQGCNCQHSLNLRAAILMKHLALPDEHVKNSHKSPEPKTCETCKSNGRALCGPNLIRAGMKELCPAWVHSAAILADEPTEKGE